MRNKVIFALVIAGIAGGLVSAYVYATPAKRVPPVFSPAPNPYPAGIYAQGIIESDQQSGANINLFPEVAGTVTHVLVSEGQSVVRGQPLFSIDDAVERATVEQQRAQAAAAQAVLAELVAEPRPETLQVSAAQVEVAKANVQTARDSYTKQLTAAQIEPRAVSADALDTAKNAARAAEANLGLATAQYELTKAGAWSYEIKNQRRTVDALERQVSSSEALLAKYVVRAPADGVVLSIAIGVGSLVQPNGVYNTYTQGMSPVMTMGRPQTSLAVRCYVDEILIPRLPPGARIAGKMFIRGTDISVPLTLVRVQPYVSPKVQLSDQRTERVDVRVLPLIFRFEPPPSVVLYPGQLVDVYVGSTT